MDCNEPDAPHFYDKRTHHDFGIGATFTEGCLSLEVQMSPLALFFFLKSKSCFMLHFNTLVVQHFSALMVIDGHTSKVRD